MVVVGTLGIFFVCELLTPLQVAGSFPPSVISVMSQLRRAVSCKGATHLVCFVPPPPPPPHMDLLSEAGRLSQREFFFSPHSFYLWETNCWHLELMSNSCTVKRAPSFWSFNGATLSFNLTDKLRQPPVMFVGGPVGLHRSSRSSPQELFR